MGRLEAHPTISIIFLWGGLGGLPRVNNIILILFQPIYITAIPGVMRYNNPTPNPLIACDEGAKMYLIRAETAVIS